MRGYALPPKRRAFLPGNQQVLSQQVLHPVSAQAATARIGKQDIATVLGRFPQPGFQYFDGLFRQRRTALFAPLTQALHMGARAQLHIWPSQTRHLGKTQTGLHRYQQEGVIAAA
jgi:hypothetical protein